MVCINILQRKERQAKKPLPPKRNIDVLRGKMGMDVTPNQAMSMELFDYQLIKLNRT